MIASFKLFAFVRVEDTCRDLLLLRGVLNFNLQKRVRDGTDFGRSRAGLNRNVQGVCLSTMLNDEGIRSATSSGIYHDATILQLL